MYTQEKPRVVNEKPREYRDRPLMPVVLFVLVIVAVAAWGMRGLEGKR
jgi:hypothetical protein